MVGEKIIEAAASGATKVLAEKGTGWLVEQLAAHSPAARDEAEKNLVRFVVRLDNRVAQLEAEQPLSTAAVSSALSHPQFSLLSRKAMLAAAMTDNDDRHAILAGLILQRLNAEADDMVALAGAVACDAVSGLSSHHIQWLGLLTLMNNIRPSAPIAGPQQNYDTSCIAWWTERLPPILNGLKPLSEFHLKHLIGMGCIWFFIERQELSHFLTLPSDPPDLGLSSHLLEACDWWPTLKEHQKNIARSYLLPVGNIIGSLYFDHTFGTNLEIEWPND